MRMASYALAAVTGLMAATASAQAGIISGGPGIPGSESESGLGAFSGSLVVTQNGPNAATLTITLTNELTTAAGGKLVAFVFNNPNDLITGATLNPNPPAAPGEAFELSFGNGAQSANPFGDFDFLLSITGDFEGGGSPNPGLLVGETGVFSIDLTGIGVGSLTQEDFESALSTDAGGGGAQFFVARFRGFDNGGSDKVTGVPGPPFGTPPAIPEPASLALAAVGTAGLAGVRRLRRRSA